MEQLILPLLHVRVLEAGQLFQDVLLEVNVLEFCFFQTLCYIFSLSYNSSSGFVLKIETSFYGRITCLLCVLILLA